VQCTHGEGAVGSIRRLRAMGMAGSLWWDWGLQYFYDLSISFTQSATQPHSFATIKQPLTTDTARDQVVSFIAS